MSTLQRGHNWPVASLTSVRSAFAPQWEQNFSPTNIIPKQDGQATVARRAPQWSQRVASVEAGAPHMGHLRVSAGINGSCDRIAKSPARPLQIPPEIILSRFAPDGDDGAQTKGTQ
jgi:hypothetical protein